MNENVSAILKGVVGLVSELDKLPGVATKLPEENVTAVRQMHQAWDRYQKNLHNGWNGNDAKDELIQEMGRTINRSRFEYREPDYKGREDMGG